MKKHFLATSLIFLSLLILFMGFNVNASSPSISLKSSFGGRIIKDKSLQIEALEQTGFLCVAPGKTITIKPARYSYPTEYYVNPSAKSKTAVFRPQKLILGLYTKTPILITCTNLATGVTTMVELPIITTFATS